MFHLLDDTKLKRKYAFLLLAMRLEEERGG